jgi:tRNA_anti-like
MKSKYSLIMKYVKILFVIAGLGIITGFYFYNKPVKSTKSKNADVVIRSEDLFNEFSNDENAANNKYLDKIISISGEVTNIANEDGLSIVTLKTNSDMFGVICKIEQNEDKVKTIKAGDKIKVKGACTGMLMDVVMVRCVIE